MALILPTANSASLLTLNGWPASPLGLWAGEQGLGVFGNTVKIVKFASQGWESQRPGSGFPGENHRQIPGGWLEKRLREVSWCQEDLSSLCTWLWWFALGKENFFAFLLLWKWLYLESSQS